MKNKMNICYDIKQAIWWLCKAQANGDNESFQNAINKIDELLAEIYAEDNQNNAQEIRTCGTRRGNEFHATQSPLARRLENLLRQDPVR
jgi:hypothetical protein